MYGRSKYRKIFVVAMAHQVVSDYTKVSENANVKVFVRARPPETHDEPAEELFELGDAERGGRIKKLSMKQWKRARSEDGDHEQWGGVGGNAFQFDGVFWCNEKQTTVFETVCREQVDHILKGYNACCFAYGQTGSGKTHTMFFPRGGQDRSDQTTHGLIPRAVDYLFASLQPAPGGVGADVKVSFLEVYCDTLRDSGKVSLSTTQTSPSHGVSNEKTSHIYQGAAKQREETFGLGMRGNFSASSVFKAVSSPPIMSLPDDDTLAPEKTKGNWCELKEEIREDKDGTVFVKGLAKIPVKNSTEVLQVIDRGLRLRATESTSMNDTSSRSHTVFTIEVAAKDPKSSHALAGKLHLVDLAGSERLKKSESSGIRMEEALHINKSLTALGKVIVSLDPAQTNAHVPYRDSKLTRLLQNALGGDSYTSVLATIRPTRSHAEECLSTLQFANRCRKVANNPRVHRVGETDAHNTKAKDELIARLRAEVERLKDVLQKLKHRMPHAPGLNTEEFASSEYGGTDSVSLPVGGYDLAQTQATVCGAVIAALRAAGVTGATIDESTGGVRLSDGRLLEGTLPGAFLAYQCEGKKRRQGSDTRPGRGSAVFSPLATNVAKAMGYLSPRDVPRALIAVLLEHEDQFLGLKRKLESAKAEADVLRKSVELGKRQILSTVLSAQRIETESKSNVLSAAKQMREEIRSLKEFHHQQLQALARENNQIIGDDVPTNQAAIGIAKRPQTKLLRDMEMSHKINEAYNAVQRAEGRATGSKASITNLKKQYNYWLNKKDNDSKHFISQLNLYRRRKNAQLEAADQELLKLWDAIEHHSSVLRRVRQGKYPLQQLINNVAAPDIPADDLPPSIELLTLRVLPVTHLAKLKRERQLKGGTAEFSEGTRRQPDVEFCAGVTQPPLWNAAFSDETDVNLGHPKGERLVEAGQQLGDKERLIILTRADVKSLIRAETSAHETVEYVRDLEQSKKVADTRISEQAQQYARLKVAYESLKRNLSLRAMGN